MRSEYHHHARDCTSAKSHLQGSHSLPTIRTSIFWLFGSPGNELQDTGGWISGAVVQLPMGNVPSEDVSGACETLVEELSRVSSTHCTSAGTTLATMPGAHIIKHGDAAGHSPTNGHAACPVFSQPEQWQNVGFSWLT